MNRGAASVLAVCLLAVTLSWAVEYVSAPRVEVGGRLLVPLRGVLESLGFAVDYVPVGSSFIISITPGPNAPPSNVNEVILTGGSSVAIINTEHGQRRESMGLSPRVISSKTYVPLRFVAEAFGYDVDYQGSYVDFIWGDNTAVRLMLGGGGGSSSGGGGGGGQIAPWTASRKATNADLAGYSNWTLTLMRNEIYARHGRPFENAHVRAYFLNQPWYAPNASFRESWLNSVEKYNADFIKRYQVNVFGGTATHP